MDFRRLIGITAFALSSNLSALPLKSGKLKEAILTPLAIVEHDCAPWDGPAFGIWIPAETLGGSIRSWVYLRIWQRLEDSKDLFTFPNVSQKQKGAVMYLLDLASPKDMNWQKQSRQQLKGTVRFLRVSAKENVLGELDFISEKNIHLRGRFEAKWNHDHKAVCG